MRSNASTARAVASAESVSTLFGHIHRVETNYTTVRTRTGGITRIAHSPGCPCRIDGAVPSTKSSTTLDGRPVLSAENWQQDLAVVHNEEGDGPFSLESVFIDTMAGHRAAYGGQVYTPLTAD